VTYNTALELDRNRKMTDFFIKTHPRKTAIVLSRETFVNDGAGGWKRSGVPQTRSSQDMAFLPVTTQLPVRRTQDGQEVNPEYTLIARYDAVIEPGDWFWVNGVKYEVVFIHPDKSYEIKAEVTYRG